MKVYREGWTDRETKFYTFYQNNSYGRFDVDEGLGISEYVIVEAYSWEDANSRASAIGLYFDGEDDCPCCGNRWEKLYRDSGTDRPSVYETPVDFVDRSRRISFIDRDQPFAFVHYIDGRLEGY